MLVSNVALTTDADIAAAFVCLGAGEVERLTPLAARWLATGATVADLRQAVTADLPTPVKSAAALISSRHPLPRGIGKGTCRRCAALPSCAPRSQVPRSRLTDHPETAALPSCHTH